MMFYQMILPGEYARMNKQPWEIRRDNLQGLIDSFQEAPGNRAAFCRKYNLDPLQIGQYFTSGKNARRMGEKKAREIEEKLSTIPAGWLDEIHQAFGPELLNALAPTKFDANVRPVALGGRPIPVISLIQAGRMTEITDPYPPGAGFAVEYVDESEGYSRWAFALEIEGFSMTPEFQPGDRVVIDPEIAPNPGDFVVARNTHEEATFKKYRPRGIDAGGNMIFELVPLNPDYPTMRSDIEHLQVIGTMVEHRKKRRRK